MAIQQCERCGADLPPTLPGSTVTCGYCNAVQLVSASPAARAPVSVDPARLERLVDVLVRGLRRTSGFDASHDAVAMPRVREAAARALAELDRDGHSDVSLPFLGANAQGPVHLSRRITRGDLERGTESPFAPEEDARAVAHGEELGTQEARMEALRQRLGVREGAQPASRSALIGCSIVVAVLAGGGIVAFLAMSGSGSGDGGVAALVPGLASSPAAVITDVDRGSGWVAFAPEGMPGTLARFDPIAGEPWALSLARQWAPDASLESFYVNRVRADGTIAAQERADDAPGGEPEADYRFVSIVRRRAAAQRIQVAENDVRSSFRILVHDGKVEAMSSTEDGDDLTHPEPPPFVPGCPLARVMAAMRAGGLPLRPAWDIAATSRDWQWWIDQTDVGGDIPRVDSATCAVAR